MPDREKVIQHFEAAIEAGRSDNNWRFVRVDIINDALVLLKEQEPRVLTLEETETCDDVVWMDKNIPEWEIMPVFVNETGRYLDTFITRSGWRFQEAKCRGYGNYGETWRCWSAKPSNEKREATPWQD